MKFSKIASAAAAIAAAGMMTVCASADLVQVKNPEGKLHQGSSKMWLLVPQFDGVREADKGKPEGTIEGLDFSKIAKLSITLTVPEDQRIDFFGGIGGQLVLSMNAGDIKENSDEWNTYNWQSKGFWGVDDEDLGLTASVDDTNPATAVKIADYTYKITTPKFDNPLANGTASNVGLIQFAYQDSSTDMCLLEVVQFEALDENDNVLVTFDSKGNYTLGGGSSTPAPDKTDDKTDTSTPSNNVDTGVEGVAAVVGVAALAAGAVVLSRKRK